MSRSLRVGPPSPSPPPGWCSPHPRALWVSCDGNSCLNEHALCPIIMRLLQRQWPVEARPAWGLWPWEAPCTWAWRWVKGGGLVVLATPEACPRVLGPALQDPLSASSLTGSPPGSVWARLTARGRGSGVNLTLLMVSERSKTQNNMYYIFSFMKSSTIGIPSE